MSKNIPISLYYAQGNIILTYEYIKQSIIFHINFHSDNYISNHNINELKLNHLKKGFRIVQIYPKSHRRERRRSKDIT